MKIPFNIKYRPQIESGEYKVETRDGRPARIICWDIESFYPQYKIGALIKSDDGEVFFSLTEEGYFWIKESRERDSNNDLFIITPEPELTPFEQHLLVYLQKVYYAHCESQDVNDFVIGTIKQSSKSLLEFAKKEICKGCSANLEGYIKGITKADKDYQQGYMDGYKKAEEDYNKSVTYHYQTYQPPCFNGEVRTNPQHDCINCPRQSSGTTVNTSETNKAE